ncbi:Vesicle tethering protein Uso1/P115-like [Macleaya cordata]|uniref:Vesicle tethering protein Uso1/P115-like n=1 Tax=Macleaya cordata TaxID=56857 RepID=A0A200QD55_MACCD|nr:Vesicle tethering protein Uso1/P115-like [Macleaya cordata]
MDFKLGRINLNAVAQGVGGLVFGNESSASSDDSYVERLLDRISNGVLAEDRRAAMTELQSIVAESRSAQLAFGAMGFPVLMSVLREERDDVEMVRGAVETLVSALTPINSAHGPKNEVQSTLMNSDLLSREAENISLLLSLLAEEDFYVRYYTLQLLTALLTHSQNRLQEAILTIPRGITRLMDMLMDREVIRNEALLLLTYLTREAEEIQKILVFEGAFEKIFSIIKEEGGSEGGVVVQDCLELLNNLLRNSASNQILLRETMGFEPIISILKLRGSSYSFTQQKTVNLLSALETIQLLLVGGREADPGKDTNRLSNQTVLAQKKVLDHLLMLGVESPWAAVAVRCMALRCIGDLVARHPQNLDALASKLLGEEPNSEPALNSILLTILRTSSTQEFLAADYVFKRFCEENSDGQARLASTMIPQTNSMTNSPVENNNMKFGSMLLLGLTVGESDGDLESCCRAASVLSHLLKNNIQCKERVLQVKLEAPMPSLGASEPLMHRIVVYLALAASMKNKDSNHKSSTSLWKSYTQPIILRLLVTWLADCPNAVDSFLDSRHHLTYLLELVSSPSETVFTRGLAAILLGECVLYNKSVESGRDAFMVVDAISQKIGLTSYFLKFDEMQKRLPFVPAKDIEHRKPLARSNAASMEDVEDAENDETDQKNDEHSVLLSIFDTQFVNFLKSLEANIRESIVELFSHPKSKVVVVPAELEQKDRESNEDYIKRLKSFVEKQCSEMQDLLGRNATLAEDLAKTGGAGASGSDQKPNGGRERVQNETLRRDLQEAMQRLEILKSEKAKLEAEASMYQNIAGKMESDLKSLSDAYNSLEQTNFRLESEVLALRKGGSAPYIDIEAVKAEAREEAEKESEAELNDLLVCLGQEQSKVDRLSKRLEELGEDVDSLLEGIGDDDAGLPEDDDDEEED